MYQDLGLTRFYVELARNVVHGSDSPENGKREIGKASYAIQFNPNTCNKHRCEL